MLLEQEARFWSNLWQSVALAPQIPDWHLNGKEVEVQPEKTGQFFWLALQDPSLHLWGDVMEHPTSKNWMVPFTVWLKAPFPKA